jgi:hypothetical protein
MCLNLAGSKDIICAASPRLTSAKRLGVEGVERHQNHSISI